MNRGNPAIPASGWRNRRAIAAALTLACSIAATPANAQSVPASGKVSTNGGAKVVIVRPLTFIKVSDLNFGQVAVGNSAGTVTVSPFNVRTRTGGVAAAVGTSTPASFAGLGAVNQLVSIKISATSITLVRQGGSQTMTANNFIIGSTPTAPLTTAAVQYRIASATGMFQFPVGATLNVGANQMPGKYTGTFSITLNYL
jgi:hypothetical protein